MKKEIMESYALWLQKATADEDLVRELRGMEGDEARIEDAFYRHLAFGTGGLRGVIGAGTNRMNVYTVAKASQGLARYILAHFPKEARRVAVSRDSRIKSELFSRVACAVFAANGIRVFIYPELMPTPCLSYAVRALGCAAGVMVTASHNPSQYNGYKVYGSDGCQITTEAAAAILGEIEKVNEFDAPLPDFDALMEAGRIEWIGGDVYAAFTEAVKAQSVLFGDEINRDVAIVYSPLNGAGLKPVTRALTESGFTNITVVKEQEAPDGRFPTCPYPNPEIREAMQLGIRYCERTGADLLLATDPDCDRCGIAVKDEAGQYTLLTGNETGLLLLDFICGQRVKHGKMPEDPVFVKTIVTTDLAERIAARYGVRTVNVLTGFKFIGEQIGLLEKRGRADAYICGFEESYGYLTGTHVRDKDAVNAALMISEMFAYYRTRGVSLTQRLAALYAEYGYCLNTLHSYQFDGSSGMARMNGIMAALRQGVGAFAGLAVEETLDYLPGLDGLPSSDVLKYRLAGGSAIVVRPSGTEPKLKAYLSVAAPDREKAEAVEKRLAADLAARFAQDT
ncbi:MAG: phospho-sugar mutase [Clostridia bacterium]|nr:phospho-sugar mutase [Clostridia bacterium]